MKASGAACKRAFRLQFINHSCLVSAALALVLSYVPYVNRLFFLSAPKQSSYQVKKAKCCPESIFSWFAI